MIQGGDPFVGPYHEDGHEGETVPEEAKRKYLRVYPDTTLYRRLREDIEAALPVLHRELTVPSKTRTVEERAQVVSQFCAILKVLLDDDSSRTVLLMDDFAESLWRLVLDPRMWHLIHDNCDASWVDCVGVVSIQI